jgi:hypothetical protein
MIDVWGLAPWQLFPLIPGVGPALEPEPDPPKQRPYKLKIKDDCYDVPRNGAVTRNITYELYDDDNKRIQDAVITEHLVGDLPVTGAVLAGTPNGRYEDQLSTHNNFTRVIQSLSQTFTAHVIGGAEVNVFVEGLGGQFSPLAISKFRDFVKVNGDYGGVFDRNGKFRPNEICGEK